jgi:hypothetical protein
MMLLSAGGSLIEVSSRQQDKSKKLDIACRTPEALEPEIAL